MLSVNAAQILNSKIGIGCGGLLKMIMDLRAGLRSTISHAALSASVVFSSSAFSAALAQQSIDLDTVNVSGQTQRSEAPSEGSYNVPVLSSPKQTAPLLDTPQTITVVPQQVIQDTGSRNLTEVLRNTPGITFDAGENGFASTTNNFKLRGFNTGSSVFIDGARDNGSYARDVFNIERVEIFKGPSADNGRGNGGGYVNLVTKLPSLHDFYSGEIGYGWDQYSSDPRRRATMDVNHVFAPNAAFRLNAMIEDSGVAGREFAKNRPWGIAPSLAFGLNSDQRAFFSFEHQTRRDIPDWGIPAAGVRGMMRYDPVAASAPRDAYYGLRSDYDRVESNSALARFEKDLSEGVTISNQTRWSQVHRWANYTPLSAFTLGPPSTVTTANQGYDRTNTTISNLTNLSAEFFAGGFKHNLATGLEITREESDANRFANGAATTTDLFDPDPNRVQPMATPAGTNNIKINTVAAYLNDTLHLNEQWQITGGVRAEHYKVNVLSRDEFGAPTGPIDNFGATETTLGGKLALVYKPYRNVSYYAAASLSHDPPAGNLLSNPDISREADGDAFPNLIAGADPVRVINYEIGTKWDFFDGRLSTSAALFHTDKRVPITGCELNLAGTACAGSAESLQGYAHQIAQGLELSATGSITKDWKIFGGLLWMKTHRDISERLDILRSNGNRNDYGCPALPAPCTVRTDGDELAFTPKFSANMWTTYHIPTTKWTVGAGVQYVGWSWAGRPDDARRIIKNGVFGKMPSYFLVNGMVSYELRKNVNVVFNVDNIANEKYAISTNWAAQRAILGAPRTYRVSMNFRY